MENFEFEYKGKKYWYSRSLTAVVYAFAYSTVKKQWCVLADKRGPGCPTCVGQWNVPCGYLDHNESILANIDGSCKGSFTEGAALRELREETGLKLTPWDLHLYSLFSLPIGKKQNVNCSFYAVLPKPMEYYREELTTENSEPNEVAEIKWIPINRLDQYEFAFRQKPIIYDIYHKYVKIGLFRKIMLKLSHFLNRRYRNTIVL